MVSSRSGCCGAGGSGAGDPGTLDAGSTGGVYVDRRGPVEYASSSTVSFSRSSSSRDPSVLTMPKILGRLSEFVRLPSRNQHGDSNENHYQSDPTGPVQGLSDHEHGKKSGHHRLN